MKTLFFAAALLISSSTFAKQPTIPGYPEQAVAAAKALNTVNWGKSLTETFEIIKEETVVDDVHAWSTFTVRVFTKDIKTGKKYDGGKDFKVYIADGAVLRVVIDCRTCG